MYISISNVKRVIFVVLKFFVDQFKRYNYTKFSIFVYETFQTTITKKLKRHENNLLYHSLMYSTEST